MISLLSFLNSSLARPYTILKISGTSQYYSSIKLFFLIEKSDVFIKNANIQPTQYTASK